MEVGKRIKFLREKSKMSQNKLAEWAGISQTHLRRVELGQAGITVEHLQLICDALNITLKEFFDVGNEKEDLTDVFSSLTPKQKQLLIEFLKTIK